MIYCHLRLIIISIKVGLKYTTSFKFFNFYNIFDITLVDRRFYLANFLLEDLCMFEFRAKIKESTTASRNFNANGHIVIEIATRDRMSYLTKLSRHF